MILRRKPILVRSLDRAVTLAGTLLLIAGCGGSSSSDVNANPSGDLKYVALGASDAAGFGASSRDKSYPFLIEDGLAEGNQSVKLDDIGIPGARIGDIKKFELPVAKLENPELVTLFTGANDVIQGDDPANFEADLADILSDLRVTESFVVIANLPDLTSLPRFRNDPDIDVTPARVAAFNGAIARQAAIYGVPVVDLFSEPVDDLLVSGDGFHPSDAGHQ